MNLNPVVENIVPFQFRPAGEKALRGRLFVRVPTEIEQAVRSLPDAPGWLRRAIIEAAVRDGLVPPPSC